MKSISFDSFGWTYLQYMHRWKRKRLRRVSRNEEEGSILQSHQGVSLRFEVDRKETRSWLVLDNGEDIRWTDSIFLNSMQFSTPTTSPFTDTMRWSLGMSVITCYRWVQWILATSFSPSAVITPKETARSFILIERGARIIWLDAPF